MLYKENKSKESDNGIQPDFGEITVHISTVVYIRSLWSIGNKNLKAFLFWKSLRK